MSELKELETLINQLSKRMEEQMRITRNLTALCTTLIVGLMFFIFCQTMEHLPSIIVLRYMSNLDSIVKEWRQTERCLNGPQPAPPKAAPPAAPVKAAPTK
ncbi:MAG: hypothetical protein WC028_32135 [Candidatus Obscuribacterales bacterium]